MMERIDPEMAAQVWRRVLAGREGFESDAEARPPRAAVYTAARCGSAEYAGDLPPARRTPPGIAGWKTYDVFSTGSKPPGCPRRATFDPYSTLLLLLLLVSLGTVLYKKGL